MIAGMFLGAAIALGHPPDPQRGTLQQAAQAFDDAQLHHDGAMMDRLLAPDFQYVTGHGKLVDRRAFIASMTTPGERLDPFVIRDHRVEPLGLDGGVASGDATVSGTQDGAPFSGRFRYADVFARRAGRWVVVYTQVTALPKP